MKHNSSALAGMSLFRMSMGYSLTQTKVFMFLALLLSMLFLSTLSAEAANHYIRQGATGTTGNDWTNALSNIPSTLTRGDTYYVAAGSYGSQTFSTSGTTMTYIKKATVADHGTSTGWSDSYGTGQAVFGPLTADSNFGGYLEIDGQYAYGFMVDFDITSQGFKLTAGQGGPEIHLKYIDFDGVASSGDVPYPDTNYAQAIQILWNANDTSGFLVSHCALHGANDGIWFQGNRQNATIEYNDFHDFRAAPIGSFINHTNIVWAGAYCQNITFRYNKVHNYDTEGVFLTGDASGVNSNITNWYIYGNVFYDGVNGSSGVARGLEIRGQYTYGAIYFYNNTCADLGIGCVRNFSGVSEDGNGTSGGAIRNNIGYNAGFSNGNITSSNNSSVSSSAFVSYSGKDFHLAAPTAAGYSLSSLYNMDMDGNTRGADGVWDLGAYEYTSGRVGISGIKQASPPLNLRMQ